MQEILLNIESKEIRCATLRNGLLMDLSLERKKERQLTGNIYHGKVKNILHNIQSAFIDIGEDEAGFIHISDILKNTKKFEQLYDLEFDLDYDIQEMDNQENSQDIEQLLKIDQSVLVQVVKEPIGNKGARLTSNISVAGRYLVLLPNSKHRGVSRKIENKQERERLKRIIRSFDMPQNMGLICRTASQIATTEMLINEANELHEMWEEIVKKFNKSSTPTILFEESDIIKRSILTAIDKRYDRVLVDDYNTYQMCRRLLNRYSGEHPLKLELYRDKTSMFERFNVEREIEKSLRRKIWLPQGGYLFFDKTEAMHTIDVNSGRSNSNESNVEEALVRINMEAAEEISRQLRLRNIGGLVIIDFIDMKYRQNKRRVLAKLKECMKDDSAKCTILGMSEFGLVEMTRQRHRGSLAQALFCDCPYCSGRGFIKTHESVSIEIERAVKKAIRCHQQYGIRITVHPELDRYLETLDKEYMNRFAESQNAMLIWEVDDTLHINDFIFHSSTSGREIEV
ncbi:MAG: Rne/Rng family ribonuclease [Chlamydiales bacterium]